MNHAVARGRRRFRESVAFADRTNIADPDPLMRQVEASLVAAGAAGARFPCDVTATPRLKTVQC